MVPYYLLLGILSVASLFLKKELWSLGIGVVLLAVAGVLYLFSALAEAREALAICGAILAGVPVMMAINLHKYQHLWKG